jgi:hypothetical protein
MGAREVNSGSENSGTSLTVFAGSFEARFILLR